MNTLNLKSEKVETEPENHWVSVSDIMSGLMMVFLFIAIIHMMEIRGIAGAYQQVRKDIYQKLSNEFNDHLDNWNADLERETLVLRFKEPDVLFEQGSNIVKPQFKRIIDEFFPEYIEILFENFERDIEEVRIEGHTSSEWAPGIMGDSAYIKNMELSQDRTRQVLEYALSVISNQKKRKWLKKRLTANGLSSSRPIKDEKNGKENKASSRRVEFRIKTNAEKKIEEILN